MRDGWDTKTIGDVCDVLDHKRKPITKRDRVPGKYPYFGATGVLDHVEGYLFDEPLVLVGEDGAKWDSGEYTAFAVDGKCWVNNHAHVLRVRRTQLLDNWLIYYLNHSDLTAFISGLTVPKLNQGNLRTIPIPVPPLPEQQRIVGFLDEAFAAISTARENAEKNLRNARALFESHLQSVFARQDEGWEQKRLEEVCEIIMGQSPAGSSYNVSGDGVPLINGPVEFSPDAFGKTLRNKFTTQPTKLCRADDLILCVRGSTTGRMNIAGFDACVGRGVAAIRAKQHQPWINHFINSARREIYRMGTGATFPNVSGAIVGGLRLAFPALSEQMRVGRQLDNLRADTRRLESIYQRKLAALDELKKSLLHQALTGQL